MTAHATGTARRSRAATGAIAAVLGVTAAVVIAPIASGSPASADLPGQTVTAPVVAPVTDVITAPAVEVSYDVTVVTVTVDPPEPTKPPVKTKKTNKSKSSSSSGGVSASESGKKDKSGCGDKHHG